MPALSKTLADFADAIVRDGATPAHTNAMYLHYSVATAIDIYRNNYRGNLHDTLAGAYPVIKQLVGDEFFRFMMMRFIAQYPSRSGNLHHYGADLSDFITTFAPAKELVYLADVATLEWACHVAYFAQDDATLDFNGLAHIPVEHYAAVTLQVNASCHVVRSRYPIATIWQAHQPNVSDNFQIDLDSGFNNVLVSRKADKVLVSELTDAEIEWLQHIQTNASLSEATVATLEQFPEFDLQATLLNLITHNVLAGFNLKEIT